MENPIHSGSHSPWRGIVFADEVDSIVYSNQAWQNLVAGAIPRPAPVTYRLTLQVLTGGSAAAIDDIDRCMAASHAEPCETEIRIQLNGAPRQWRVHFQRLPFDHAGLLAVHDDLTDLRREARLAGVVQDRYSRLLDASNDIVFEFDLEGTLVIAKGALDLLGYSQEDLAGAKIDQLVAPWHRDTIIRKVLEKRENPDLVTRYFVDARTKQGEFRPVEICSCFRPLISGGETILAAVRFLR